MSTTEVTIPGYVVGDWELDPAHTEIGFSVRHMMVSKVRGRFEKFSGKIVTAPNPLDSYAEAEIDLASISTGNDQRDAHLRSSDFFDAEFDPKMSYHSTTIRSAGDDLLVDGELTIRGLTKPITLTVEVGGFGPDPYGGTRLGFSAAGQLNRHDFGVSWNAALEGGGTVIGDKVTITIEAEAVFVS